MQNMFQKADYHCFVLSEFRKQFKNAKALIVGEGGLKAEEFLQMKPEMLF